MLLSNLHACTCWACEISSFPGKYERSMYAKHIYYNYCKVAQKIQRWIRRVANATAAAAFLYQSHLPTIELYVSAEYCKKNPARRRRRMMGGKKRQATLVKAKWGGGFRSILVSGRHRVLHFPRCYNAFFPKYCSSSSSWWLQPDATGSIEEEQWTPRCGCAAKGTLLVVHTTVF